MEQNYVTVALCIAGKNCPAGSVGVNVRIQTDGDVAGGGQRGRRERRGAALQPVPLLLLGRREPAGWYAGRPRSGARRRPATA